MLLTDGAPFLTTLLACRRSMAIAVLRNWRLAPPENRLDLRPGQPAVAFAKLRFAALHAEAAAGTVLMVDESHAADGLFETIDAAPIRAPRTPMIWASRLPRGPRRDMMRPAARSGGPRAS
jgi:hypothetical protein